MRMIERKHRRIFLRSVDQFDDLEKLRVTEEFEKFAFTYCRLLSPIFI